MKMKQIAIDGPAGAGKSTIAKEVSKRLGFVYVDTGAMYRTLALACIENGTDTQDEAAAAACCSAADIDIRYENGVQQMYLSGRCVSRDIRREDVGTAASHVARYSGVRSRLVALQQELGSRYDVVMDGRDIGTTVLPDADLKIYLTASVQCRAERRFKELGDRNVPCDIEKIKKDIESRDLNDMTREISPLRQAEDAIVVDTSDMDIDQVTGRIMELFETVSREEAE